MRLRAFSKSYDGRTVLRLPELELSPGGRYAVIGANGSGKSTLARCLAGVLRPDGGGAVLDGGVGVGYMPQKSYAFRMTVEKNLRLAGGTAEQAAAVMAALGLEPLRKSAAARLSGGETQRLALGRVLLGRYELLVLDEPTASMDMESTLAAERLMDGYCREHGCTLLLVTHSLSQARRMGEEVLFLHRGELAERGRAEDVLTAPKDPRTRAFLEFYGI